MKYILLTLITIALLATTGCVIFPGHRDQADIRDHPGVEHGDDHPAGVDHGEHPGDIDHGDTMQP